MATTYYWISSTASTWNTAANWSLSSGGSGGAGVPSVDDTAKFDANGAGNCTLDVDLGGGTLADGTYTPSSGIDKIEASGYPGTLDFGGYDVDSTNGITGFDGNLTWGSGQIAVSGALDVRDFGTNGNLLFYGNLTYNAGPYTQRFASCLVAENAVVSNKKQSGYASAYYGLVASDLDLYGRINQDDAAYSVLYSSGTGDINIHPNGEIHLNATCTYTVTASGIPVRCDGTIEGKLNVYKSATISGDWTSASLVRMGSTSVGSPTIGADAVLPDLDLEAPAASAYSYAFTDGAQLQGDMTAIDNGGGVTLTGKLGLSGTADQYIDLGAADSSGLTIDGTKTAGVLYLLDGDVTITTNETLESPAVDLSALSTLSGAGTLRTSGVVYASGATLEPNILELADAGGNTVPAIYNGNLTLITSSNAGSTVTPTLASSYNLLDFKLQCDGAYDLIVDCVNPGMGTLTIRGDWTVVESGEGRVRWIDGSETVALAGSSDQNITATLSVRGENIVHSISNTNTSGNVAFSELVRVGTYSEASSATTIGTAYLRLEDVDRNVEDNRVKLTPTYYIVYSMGGATMTETAEALEFHGKALTGGDALCLARIQDSQDQLVDSNDIESAEYSIYLLDVSDPDSATPVTEHDQASLTVTDVVLDAPVVDSFWEFDTTGYNFRHRIDVTTNAAFSLSHRHYRIEYVLTPYYGNPIRLRFRVFTI
jgi:hypothetical protein